MLLSHKKSSATRPKLYQACTIWKVLKTLLEREVVALKVGVNDSALELGWNQWSGLECQVFLRKIIKPSKSLYNQEYKFGTGELHIEAKYREMDGVNFVAAF